MARDSFHTPGKSTNSSFRELSAVKYSIDSFNPLLKNEKVLSHLDNMNGVELFGLVAGNSICKVSL